MMRFEIINPSDKAFMEGDLKVAAIAITLLSKGQYALKEVDGNGGVPLFIFGGGDEWFQDNFQQTIQEAYDSCSNADIAAALLSVELAGERSSMNDFTSKAHKMAERLLELAKEEASDGH